MWLALKVIKQYIDYLYQWDIRSICAFQNHIIIDWYKGSKVLYHLDWYILNTVSIPYKLKQVYIFSRNKQFFLPCNDLCDQIIFYFISRNFYSIIFQGETALDIYLRWVSVASTNCIRSSPFLFILLYMAVWKIHRFRWKTIVINNNTIFFNERML